MRWALGLEYDGRSLLGWQVQAEGRTGQGEVERALAAIAGDTVRTACAGRTDAGVHATCQVIHFDTDVVRPGTAWVRGVNAHLPGGMAVQWACQVCHAFHARFSAQGRRYRYVLLNRAVRPALLDGLVGWYHRPLDAERMADAARCLLGTHDFSSFRAAQCQARSPVRELRMARITRRGDCIMFDFEANGFLHHMVRNMVGALVAVGSGGRDAAWLESLLAWRDRTRGAPTFSPHGLYLCGIRYPADAGVPEGGNLYAAPFGGMEP